MCDVSEYSLTNHIFNELNEVNIKIQNLWDQVYDNAICMFRKFNRVAVLVKIEYSSALCVYCSTDNLNISVSFFGIIFKDLEIL